MPDGGAFRFSNEDEFRGYVCARLEEIARNQTAHWTVMSDTRVQVANMAVQIAALEGRGAGMARSWGAVSGVLTALLTLIGYYLLRR